MGLCPVSDHLLRDLRVGPFGVEFFRVCEPRRVLGPPGRTLSSLCRQRPERCCQPSCQPDRRLLPIARCGQTRAPPFAAVFSRDDVHGWSLRSFLSGLRSILADLRCFSRALSSGKHAMCAEDQAVHLVSEVGERDCRLDALDADGTDKQACDRLLMCEHMLDGVAEIGFSGIDVPDKRRDRPGLGLRWWMRLIATSSTYRQHEAVNS